MRVSATAGGSYQSPRFCPRVSPENFAIKNDESYVSVGLRRYFGPDWSLLVEPSSVAGYVIASRTAPLVRSHNDGRQESRLDFVLSRRLRMLFGKSYTPTTMPVSTTRRLRGV